MAKLVIQNQGMTGRAHELAVDRTTIGRVEDNTFQIADSSVSSHHCEVHLRGSEIFIRDLNSTNGTFINNARITESVLKPGETLRLGQVELKLETEASSAAPIGTPAGAPAAPAPAPKKPVDATMVIPRGVSLSELEGGGRAGGFDSTSTAFSKKRKGSGKFFWIFAIVVGVIILILILLVILQAKSGTHP
jgi:pSer/pThr/pTyr-binding forkhead associated (FHA) protein